MSTGRQKIILQIEMHYIYLRQQERIALLIQIVIIGLENKSA